MRSIFHPIAGALLALLLVGRAGADVYELTWDLRASIQERRLEGEVLAGARLRFEGRPTVDGGLALELVEVVEAPWKLYWVDPWGPFGEEVKVASVIDLREGSWEALASARASARESAAERFRTWAAGRVHSPAFDGSFAFVVIGSVEGRFSFELRKGAAAALVRNRLTDRWLSGPFDAWAGRSWSVVSPGYWFWNATEQGPFSYEPHTYHGLARALPMLSLGPQPDDLGPRLDERWASAALETLVATVRVLLPQVAGREALTLDPAADPIQHTAEPGQEHYRFRSGAWVERHRQGRLPNEVAVGLDGDRFRASMEIRLAPVESTEGD